MGGPDDPGRTQVYRISDRNPAGGTAILHILQANLPRHQELLHLQRLAGPARGVASKKCGVHDHHKAAQVRTAQQATFGETTKRNHFRDSEVATIDAVATRRKRSL